MDNVEFNRTEEESARTRGRAAAGLCPEWDPHSRRAIAGLTTWAERGDLTTLARQWERRCNREW
jgi:hypothetical protein